MATYRTAAYTLETIRQVDLSSLQGIIYVPLLLYATPEHSQH